jgi:hypothetical protein
MSSNVVAICDASWIARSSSFATCRQFTLIRMPAIKLSDDSFDGIPDGSRFVEDLSMKLIVRRRMSRFDKAAVEAKELALIDQVKITQSIIKQ